MGTLVDGRKFSEYFKILGRRKERKTQSLAFSPMAFLSMLFKNCLDHFEGD